MSEKHLKKGDERPPFNGKLRLYAMRFCPYVHRVVLVLNAKQIPFEYVYINLDEKPEWFLNDVNPLGSVPALEIEENVIISDSCIINEYLEGAFPQKPIFASDPLRRAQDKLIVEHFAPAQGAYYGVAFRNEDSPELLEKLSKGFEYLQKQLINRKTTFLHGNEPGWVDYTIWPFLERIEALPHLGKKNYAITEENYKVLRNYMNAMKATPAVKSFILSEETHAKFMEARAKGAHDYDMLNSSNDACCFRPRKKKVEQ